MRIPDRRTEPKRVKPMQNRPWIRTVRIGDEPWWAISLPSGAFHRMAGAVARLFRPAPRQDR
jgi:hypothetical protein